MRIYFFALLFSLHAISAELDRESVKNITLQVANEKKLHQSRAWRKLVYYEPTYSLSVKSQVSTPLFFVSPVGRKNPESELNATLLSIFDSSGPEESDFTQCRFPARYFYLKKNLKDLDISWPDRKCPQFEKFFLENQFDELSIIFEKASPTENWLGKIFLRLKKNKGNSTLVELKAPEPLGLNFINAITAFFTFHDGQWALRADENWTNNKLAYWEYEIKMSSEARDQLIRHLWELKNSSLDYNLYQTNGAYHSLALLEAANPDLDLTSQLRWIAVPQDSLNVVWNTPDLVQKNQALSSNSVKILDENRTGAPHSGHPARRVKIGAHRSPKGDSQFHLGHRFALHDMTDSAEGYTALSQTVIGDISFIYSDLKKSFDLDQFTLFEMISSRPWEDFQQLPSWRVKFGYEQNRAIDQLGQSSWQLSGGPAVTYSLSADANSYVFLGLRGHMTYPTRETFWGVGPNMLLRWQISSRLIAVLDLWSRQDFRVSTIYHEEKSLRLQWSLSQTSALSLEAQDNPETEIYGMNWLYFY